MLYKTEPSTDYMTHGCPALMETAIGSNSSFGHVGHTIHSITVEDLQKFEPTADEINHVPVINMDLSSPSIILPHAQTAPVTGHNFTDEGMITLDAVLSTMNKRMYDVNMRDLRSRIAHAFHMKDMWAQTRKRYPEVRAAHPSDQLCHCVMDIDSNGITDMLNTIAHQFKTYVGHPVSYSTKHTKFDKNAGPAGNDGDSSYADSYDNYNVDAEQDNNKTAAHEDYVDHGLPDLKNEFAWDVWVDELKMTPDMDYNTALFIYCALNKPTV